MFIYYCESQQLYLNYYLGKLPTYEPSFEFYANLSESP
jgi:hypothetical protein